MPEATTVRDLTITPTEGGVTAPAGFRSAALHCGIKAKANALDLTVIVADSPASAAGLFTTNLAQAAPVLVSKQHLARTGGVARAIVVNSGCANACTGDQGMSDAKRMATDVAAALACDPSEVLVASTGVIGVNLKMDRVSPGIQGAVAALARGKGSETARAIMTTDPFPKEYAVTVQTGARIVYGWRHGEGLGHDRAQHGHDAGLSHDRRECQPRVAGSRTARIRTRYVQRHHRRWRVLDQRLAVCPGFGRERRHDR